MVNPVKRVARRYYVEFGLSMAAYVMLMFVSRWLLHGPMQHANEGWQIAIALLPVIAIFFVFAATVRFLLRMDELCRRICVDSLAIAGGATALIAATYGLIESDHFPHLSVWWTYVTFMVAWLVATFFVRRHYR